MPFFWNNDDDLFSTDHVVLDYSNLEAAKVWWISAFRCKPVDVPSDWDNSLPSDVALRLPGHEGPTILLCDRTEIEQAMLDRPGGHALIFTGDLQRAFECLKKRGIPAEPIQENGHMRLFEIRDTENHVIEICQSF